MTLRFGYGAWAKEMADVVIANFQAVEPNVDVTIEINAGDLMQVLYTQAAAGTTGDAQWIADAFVMNLADSKVMLDMQPLADADPEATALLNDVYPAMKGLGQWKNGLYMLAWAADAPVMYYNKKIFAKAGLPEPPPGGMKVDEFQLACQKMSNESEQIYGTNIGENWWAIYVPWIEGFGGQFYSGDKTKTLIDSPEAIEACQALADLYCKYKGHVPRGANLGGDAFHRGQVRHDDDQPHRLLQHPQGRRQVRLERLPAADPAQGAQVRLGHHGPRRLGCGPEARHRRGGLQAGQHRPLARLPEALGSPVHGHPRSDVHGQGSLLVRHARTSGQPRRLPGDL